MGEGGLASRGPRESTCGFFWKESPLRAAYMLCSARGTGVGRDSDTHLLSSLRLSFHPFTPPS